LCLGKCRDLLVGVLLGVDQSGHLHVGVLLGCYESGHPLFKGCNPLLRTALRIDQSRHLLLGVALCFDQSADQLGERQDLPGQRQTTELCTPLGVFLKNADEVAKFLDGERRASLTAERDQEFEGASTGRPFNPRWQKISTLTLAYTGDLCNVHSRFRMARLGGMLRARQGGRVH